MKECYKKYKLNKEDPKITDFVSFIQRFYSGVHIFSLFNSDVYMFSRLLIATVTCFPST